MIGDFLGWIVAGVRLEKKPVGSILKTYVIQSEQLELEATKEKMS